MNEAEATSSSELPKSTPAAAKWTGRVLSGLVGLAFLASAVGKFVGGAGLEEGFAHLGLPMEIQYPLAILELVIAIIYLVPQTSVLGAILLTGYIGGTYAHTGESVMCLSCRSSLAFWYGWASSYATGGCGL